MRVYTWCAPVAGSAPGVSRAAAPARRRAHASPLEHRAQAVGGLRPGGRADFKDTIEWESLTDPMARAVEDGRATAANMQRQAQETADSLGRDLFSSSEIVRQGTLERWHFSTAQWAPYHAVLTRRGALHFLRGPSVDACVPVATVGVRALDFDGVAGAAFALLRQQSVFQWLAGRSTKLVLRAADAAEATLWIVDLKEQMALWSGRTEIQSPAKKRSAAELAQ